MSKLSFSSSDLPSFDRPLSLGEQVFDPFPSRLPTLRNEGSLWMMDEKHEDDLFAHLVPEMTFMVMDGWVQSKIVTRSNVCASRPVGLWNSWNDCILYA